MKTEKKISLLFAFAALFLISACERDWNNPWDEFNNLSPEAWAPQNLQIEDVSITEKKLTWTYGDYNIEGFKLDRKKGSEPWQVAYQTFPKETRSWSDPEIIPDPSLTYEYRVYAFAGKQISAQPAASAVADFAAPTSLAIEKLTDKSYKLTWTDNSTGEQGFKIDRKIDEGNWATAFATLAANQTSFIDTNVFRATNVEYRVYGFYESYETSKTNIASSAELVAPTDLQIEKISDKSLQLSWTDNANGEEGYKIDRKVDNGDWVPAYGIVVPNQVSFVDTNVFRAVNIEYQVYAFAGNTESQKIAANTNAELTAPTNLAIIQNSITSVTLNWQDNSNGEDGFRIDRKYEGGDWQLLTTTKDNHFEDNGFELNTQVYYLVSAFVGQYNSSFAEKNFDSQIPAPTNLLITPNSITSVTLTWQDNSDGEEGFKIYRKYDAGNWELFATTQSNQLVDNDFELNRQVFYRVFSYFSQSNSDYIDGAFYSTIPAPTNLQITPNSITSVTLTWQDNSNGEEGFKIDRKINSGAWELEYTAVGSNQTSFTDNSINWQENMYIYKIYSFYGDFNSYTIESAISWPEVMTAAISNITYTSATTGGSISADGNYTITARGVWYGTTPNPQISGNHTINGSGVGTFTSNLSDLTEGTNYYIRAYATFGFGTAYGNELSFTTPIWQCGNTFTDSRDNNDYITVQIDNQCWIKENLAYLPSVCPSARQSSTLPVYYVYGYEGTNVTAAKSTANYQTYGVLYNWPASLEACPNGWHLPSVAEWTTLTTYLGGESVAGGKMKETGTVHWQSPNTGATNSSGFTGLPGGFRSNYGYFNYIGYFGYWWSSTENSSTGAAWERNLTYNHADVYSDYFSKAYGFSVRCLRDW